MKFAFFTLGCKVNRFESQALSQLAVSRGHQIVSADADAVIINTCTVTSVSDHKNIRAFHKLRREHPRAILAACGCFAQTSPEQIRALPEIDLVCGTANRAEILTLCESAFQNDCLPTVTAPAPPPQQFEILPAGVPKGRTRALLKVQDGCDNYCSYCIIPYARGHIRSMPLAQVLAQVGQLSDQGVREIILTGIEIAAYGRDLTPQTSLVTMLDQVCAAVPHIRIRLSSLEPRIITEDFCTRLSHFSNLMRHFHLSLQSGCDNILKRMNRRYTTAEFYQCTQRLRANFPHCAITTDIIAGFPGETAQEHAQTLDFIQTCQFASMHIFPYSPRTGTPAAEMPHQIAPAEKQARAAALKAAAAQMEHAYLASFLGKTLEILLENPKQHGIFSGHTPYHFTVQIHSDTAKPNQLVQAHVTQLDETGLHGNFI